MKILMLSAYFPPEVGSAAHLFADLGREMARHGHEVTVLTGYPTYNVERSQLPPRYLSGWWMTERMSGMTVIRVRTLRMPRHIPVLRGLDQVTAAVLSAVAGVLLARGGTDIVLVYSPPLFLGVTGLLLRTLKRSRLVLNVQDLFPQSAVDLGLLRNRFLIAVFRRIERLLYRRSDMVTVHSAGNREHVLRCGGSQERTRIVPNVVDIHQIMPGPRENAFREQHGITAGQFVVSFAGVLGYSQDLDTVIEAAGLLASAPEIVVYIVGDGVEKRRLVEKARGMGNVKFLPMLPKDEYPALLHASDVCLATLRAEVRTPVVPSKILSIMAAGRPVVAGMPLDGDAPALIRAAECGVCVEPQDPVMLAEAIRGLSRSPERTLMYGRNGRAYAEGHLSLAVCESMYEEVFQSVSQNR